MGKIDNFKVDIVSKLTFPRYGKLPKENIHLVQPVNLEPFDPILDVSLVFHNPEMDETDRVAKVDCVITDYFCEEMPYCSITDVYFIENAKSCIFRLLDYSDIKEKSIHVQLDILSGMENYNTHKIGTPIKDFYGSLIGIMFNRHFIPKEFLSPFVDVLDDGKHLRFKRKKYDNK